MSKQTRTTQRKAAAVVDNHDEHDCQDSGIYEPLIRKSSFTTSVGHDGVWWLQGSMNCAYDLAFEEISSLAKALNHAAMNWAKERSASLMESK